MYKKCKVVMLATNEKAPLIIGKTKVLFHNEKEYTFKSIQAGVYQHLYILSDDEIKEGDWYLKSGNNIIDNTKIDSKRAESLGYLKIIVSTDSSLTYMFKQTVGTYKDIEQKLSLSSIPQLFIDKYVSEYNGGNKIEEAMVEYETDFSSLEKEGNIEFEAIKLKLNLDNTINIKPIKDSWTREEVEYLILEFGTELIQWAKNYIRDSDTKDFNQNEWIESNL
jgi:hypothetical protein